MDLAAAVGFDAAAAHRNVQAVRPGMQVLEVSARSGKGMEPFFHLLESQLAASRGDRGTPPGASDVTP
jgi:hydrogenase nickel incorporation protein HypB